MDSGEKLISVLFNATSVPIFIDAVYYRLKLSVFLCGGQGDAYFLW